MKRFLLLLALCAVPLHLKAQTASTQYQHIAYSWIQGPTLNVCTTGTTSPTSCVKDYALTLTDPSGKASSTIKFAYPATSYLYGPGGFLYCGTWQASLVIEYFDDKGVAQTTTPAINSTQVGCPFVVSPPSGFSGSPQA